MPHRLNEFRAKVQFVTSARTPSLLHRAAKVRGYPSNTVYIQHVLAEAISKDLDIDLAELLAELPPPRSLAANDSRFHPDVEEVG